MAVQSKDPAEGDIPRVKEFRLLSYLPAQIEIPIVSDPKEFLKAQFEHFPQLRDKVPGLQALLENTHRIETLAAYGLGFGGAKRLAHLILAIDRARRSHPEKFKGAVVIPFLSSFNEEEWRTFYAQLDAFGGPRPVLVVQGATSFSIKRTLSQLQNDDILLMPVGSVPQEVWNLLVNQSSLPPTVAGTTGTNFAKARGRPFINTVDELKPLSHFYPENRGVRVANKAVADAIMVKPGKNIDASLESLSGFILDSMDPNSQVSQAFRAQGEATRNLPDKINVALVEAKNFIRTNSSPEKCLTAVKNLLTH